MMHDIFHNIVALTSFYCFLFRPIIDITLSSLLFFREKKKGLPCVVITPHPMVHCHLDFFGKLIGTTNAYQGVPLLQWVPLGHSKAYCYLTTLPCFMHFKVRVTSFIYIQINE